jgi:hypothetical protein
LRGFWKWSRTVSLYIIEVSRGQDQSSTPAAACETLL